MPSQTPHEALSKLLTRLFNAPELREFLRFGPDASGIYPYLPEHGVSQAELALAVVDLLERRGRIDGPWFQRLQEARPGRRAEVRAVAAMFLVDAPEPQAAPPAPKPAVVVAPVVAPAEIVHANIPSGPSRANRRVSYLWVLACGAPIAIAIAIWGISQSQRDDPRAAPTPPGPARESGANSQPGAAETVTPEREAASSAAPTAAPATPVLTPPANPVSAVPGPEMTPESTSTKPSPMKEPPSRRTTKVMTQTVDRAAGKAIDDCAAQAGALTEETVTVDLEIAASGKITATLAHGTTLGGRYHDCVAAAVRAVKFPAVTHDQRFQYQRKVR